MVYRIVWTSAFDDGFKRLDKKLQKRVSEKIEFLAQNPNFAERVAHVPAELNNLLKYKVGSWRILFWMDNQNKILTLYSVGHRSKVYKKF